MKEIREMTTDELLERCIQKRTEGISYVQIANFLNKHEIESETKKYIFDKLDKLDKAKEEVQKKNEKSNIIKNSLKALFSGLGLFFIAICVFLLTPGAIFVFNIILFISAIGSIISGIVGLIIGGVKSQFGE